MRQIALPRSAQLCRRATSRSNASEFCTNRRWQINAKADDCLGNRSDDPVRCHRNTPCAVCLGKPCARTNELLQYPFPTVALAFEYDKACRHFGRRRELI